MEENYKTDIEAEAVVIGSILLDPDIGIFACQRQGVTEQTFYNELNRTIYSATTELLESNTPIDVLTVKEYLKKKGIDVSDTMLPKYIDKVATVHHAEYYVGLIKGKERIRNIEFGALRAVQECKNNMEPHEVMSSLMSVLLNESKKIEVQTLQDLQTDKIEQWKKAKDVGFVGIPSGFRYINQYLGGYRKGVHTVLGGFRGEGKSIWSRQECLTMAKQNIPVLLLSLEDPADVAAAGIVGNYGGFSVFRHDIGHGNDESIRKADQAWDNIAGLPLYITSQPMNINQICATVNTIKARFGIQIVFLDHLQYILSHKKFNSRNEEVGYYSQQICALARRLNIAFVSLSQFSRVAEREKRKPRLSDLRDSGTIEQDARAVLLLYWDSKREKHLLRVAKNNYGPSGVEIILERHGERQRFDELGITDNTLIEEELPKAWKT